MPNVSYMLLSDPVTFGYIITFAQDAVANLQREPELISYHSVSGS